MKCEKCGTTKHYPAYGAVCKGQAGHPMNGGQRAYSVRDVSDDEVALCSYTINDCHECGLRRAREILHESYGLGTIHLIKFEVIEGVGRVQELIKDVTHD